MKTKIDLNKSELQSGHDRVKHAESLILQIPQPHDGRDTWLLNYGTSEVAERMRAVRGIKWNSDTESAETVTS